MFVNLKQNTITKNSTFNATIKIRETTTFPDQPLSIPAHFVVTVPAKYEIPKSMTNLIYITLGIAVSLLLVVVVVLVWKLKAKKKTDSGNFLVFNVINISNNMIISN